MPISLREGKHSGRRGCQLQQKETATDKIGVDGSQEYHVKGRGQPQCTISLACNSRTFKTKVTTGSGFQGLGREAGGDCVFLGDGVF